jgi:hypothetical protein
MAKFGISFIVDSKDMGHVLEVLQPYRPEDLNFKLVAGSTKKLRNGDKTSHEIVAELADSTPRPMKYFREKLLAGGFRNGTVYNAMAQAIEKKVVAKKMVNGVPHYVRGK